MSEENTEGTEITPEQIDAAKQLLTQQGLNVLDQDSFSKRLAKERSKPERDLEALRADFEALKAKHSELSEFKKEIDNKDKSELQLWEDRQKAWKEQDAKRQSELEKAMADLESERKRNSDFMLQSKLRTMLTDPINEEMALMWAQNNLKGLTVDDSGNLVFTEDTGDVLEGELAAKKVSDWWASQTDLQRPKSPGPDTRGQSKAPPPPDNSYKPLDPSADLQDRLAVAAKANPVKYV
jgi:hypothetical protein